MTTKQSPPKTTTSKTTKSTTTKRAPRTKKKTQTYQSLYLVIGLIIAFFSVITVFNWGFFGLVSANFFRLLVGEAYTLLVPIIFIYALRMMFVGNLPAITVKPLAGGVLVMSAITTLLHFNTFYYTGATAQTIFNDTFSIFRNELLTSQNYQSLGGGMLGALYYGGFGYLFSYWGTYLLVFLLFFSGLFLTVGITAKELLEAVKSLGRLFTHAGQSSLNQMQKAGKVFQQVKVEENQQYVPAIQRKQKPELNSETVGEFTDQAEKTSDGSTQILRPKNKPKLFKNLFKQQDNTVDIQRNQKLEASYQPSISVEVKTRREWETYTQEDAMANTAASKREILEERKVLDLDYFDEMNRTKSSLNKAQESGERSSIIQRHEMPTKESMPSIEEQVESPLPAENLVSDIPSSEPVATKPAAKPVEDSSVDSISQAATHWQEGINQRQALTDDQLDAAIAAGSQNSTPVSKAEKRISKSKVYRLPGKDLLNKIPPVDQSEEYERINENIIKLERTFESFGVKAKVVKANLGPSVTKYEIEPAIGVKVSKIVSLTDDIALALAARDVRMEAPIPGKSLIGIEVPNNQVSPVSFNEIIDAALESDNLLEVPLGRDISGSVCLADLSKMPHLLIAGATGSGKSVGMNVIIVSLLMKAKPEEVKFIMIDPKKVELTMYDGIPHLLSPVVTNPRKAAQALNKVVQEMERRYELFATTGVRNVDSYNEQVERYNEEEGTVYERIPKIVVFVDELADLMMVASNDVENAIIRLAQMARAAGIHMIIATQRPSVDVITGIIKANVPSRLAFAVSSGIDSRTILDGNGAEKLLGRGDMLFQPMGKNKPVRVQGAYISDSEVEKITDFIKNQREAEYDEAMIVSEDDADTEQVSDDEYFEDTINLIRGQETVSISQLQRKFRIGYNRAARLIDDLESIGYVSEQDGSKPRQVLIGEQTIEL